MPSECEIRETLIRRGFAGDIANAVECAKVLINPRFCGVSLSMATDGLEFCAWPQQDRPFRWTYQGRLPGMDEGVVRLCIREALAGIAEFIEIEFEESTAAVGTQFLFTSANLGAAGGVLAQAQLVPCGLRTNDQFQSLIQIDVNENWVRANTPSGLAIDLVRVLRHEASHSLGLGHIGPGNLLAPTYSTTIRGLQPGDVNALVGIGYRRRTIPRPNVPVPPVVPWTRFHTTQLAAGQTFMARTPSLVVSYPA